MEDQNFTITYSHITIKKIVKNRAYVAEFTFNYNGGTMKKDIEASIHGKSVDDCISKTEKFLNVKLTESDYTKPNN